MRTNQRAAVVITKGEEILLINRNKGDFNYYIIPGGGVESEETPEQAAVREIKEELGLDVIIKEELVRFEKPEYTEYYFLADSFSGDLILIGDTNQTSKITDKEEWVSFAGLSTKNLLPEKIKEILIARFVLI